MTIFAHEVQGAVSLMKCLLYSLDFEARKFIKRKRRVLSPYCNCPLFQPRFYLSTHLTDFDKACYLSYTSKLVWVELFLF